MGAAGRIFDATGVDLADDLELLDLWGLTEEGGLAVEAWLAASGSPALYAGMLAGADPSVRWAFLRLVAYSRPVAAILRQNPEFASLLLEDGRDWLDSEDLRPRILAEGRLALAAATSPSHRLDRLRMLRQKWSLLAAGVPVEGGRWRIESDVADALVTLAAEIAWSPEDGPGVLIVGFGKLGGRELNRSSDLDLVYVLPDGLSPEGERRALKGCEAFGRAMETPMGRGALYRVDLRLRPFGRSGDLARSLRGYEAYYRNYAEAWEIQALLRARPIAGPPELAAAWNAMRSEALARSRWSPARVEELVAERERTERAADPSDLKRGAGGIRDAEWIAQIGALVHWEDAPPMTTAETLAALAARGALDPGEARGLEADYRVLRGYEDAVQLRGGLQTHRWPEDPAERLAAGAVLAGGSAEDVTARLDAARGRVAAAYERRLRSGEAPEPAPHAPGEFGALLARFPHGEAYARAVGENEGSAARLATALLRAPRLMAGLRDAETLEEILSGEIAEERPEDACPIGGAALRRAHAREWLRWALLGEPARGRALVDALGLAFRGSGLDVLVLGSLAMGTFGPPSDADLVLLHPDEADHEGAERAARRGLETLRRLGGEGAPAAFDLRLRPDGGKGGLVRSRRAFARYAEEGMAPWERLALGNAVALTTGRRRAGLHGSGITGSAFAARDLAGAISARPLAPREGRELLEIKARVKGERAGGGEDLKLGPGGLMDAEWVVRLEEMERGEFASGDLVRRAREVGLGEETALLVAARRRADLGAPEPDLAALAAARARVRGAWERAAARLG